MFQMSLILRKGTLFSAVHKKEGEKVLLCAEKSVPLQPLFG